MGAGNLPTGVQPRGVSGGNFSGRKMNSHKSRAQRSKVTEAKVTTLLEQGSWLEDLASLPPVICLGSRGGDDSSGPGTLSSC